MSKDFHDTSHAAEFLRKVHPFSGLEIPGLRKLAARLEAAYFPQGKSIFNSRPAPGLAIIRKGAVRLIDEKRKFLDKRSEGEVFGHEIYFHGELKDYQAEAEEDCLLWLLNPEDFTRLRSANQGVAEYFDSHVKARLSTAAQAKRSITGLRDLVKRAPGADR
jgi:signal-transduction protein with cAMP-binding, CBS, and nucleotidyltransferase domain